LKNEGVFLQTSISNFFAKKRRREENERRKLAKREGGGVKTKEMKSHAGNE
jgi:hypothetical protein